MELNLLDQEQYLHSRVTPIQISLDSVPMMTPTIGLSSAWERCEGGLEPPALFPSIFSRSYANYR
ncbi:hypothetical protein RRF57_001785 [Xylaria bambusicola]|uniref:Uncharacterized protein n=1 Tax=Xylaria bambusicola TaxID=326684 RepID=A0AAN7U5F5_9PEZI